jgi:hypothetical protein
MECEFCKNKFNSKYVLGNHQKRAKYCIEIQKKNGINNETELFKCQDCGIEIAKNSKDRHLSVCKHKLINHIKDLEQKIIEKDLLIFELKSELKIFGLKSELKIYKKLSDRTQECIEEIAKQPRKTKTTHIQNLNVLNLTSEIIQKKVEDHYNENHLLEGQPGLAKFCNDHVIRDDTGKSMITIADSSRGILKYKDTSGAVITDYKGAKFINMINKPIQSKSKDLFIEIGNRFYAMAADKEKECDKIEIERIRSEQAIDGFQSIKDIGDNATEFLKELIRIM